MIKATDLKFRESSDEVRAWSKDKATRWTVYVDKKRVATVTKRLSGNPLYLVFAGEMSRITQSQEGVVDFILHCLNE
jgi:3-deoxy-D-arabino-heptulosonate 7-phosphate (DAHP) synthase class II